MADLKDSYRNALASLLPKGETWLAKNIQESDLYKLLFAFAGMFNILHCRSDDLKRQFFVATADELVPEWENEIYGKDLFDCISDLPLDLQGKVKALIAKAFSVGGNRVEYYQEVAKVFGFELCVTEKDPDIFTARFDLGTDQDPDDPYTRPIKGTAQTITLTGVAQDLAALGVTIDPDCEKLRIIFGGDINDYKEVARYWEEGTSPTTTTGQRALTFDTIDFFPDAFADMELIAVDGNVNAYVQQYKQDFYNLVGRGACHLGCDRIYNSDFEEELQSFKCVMRTIMPAQLVFNIFVDGKLYDTIKPLNI